MDAHKREARRLIAAGADPRRADPAAAAHFGLTRALTAAQTIALGCLMGVLATMVVAILMLLAFGLRVSLATASQAENSGRAAVEAALLSVPPTEREAVLAALVKLVPLLDDPAAPQLARVLNTLTPEQRQVLATEQRLGRLLGAAAALTEQQRTTLLALIGDPHNIDLLEGMRTRDPKSTIVFDPAVVRLVAGLNELTNPDLRAAVIYIADQIRSGNPVLVRFLEAYWHREPALMAVLAAPPPPYQPQPRPRHAR